MPSVAEQLRQAREKSSLTVHEVAEATKIRTDHIRALEDGDYHVFAAPVYIRGFVRTYAALLKLNVSTVMAQLDEELSQDKKFHEPPSLTGQNRGVLDFLMLQLSKINWRITLPIAGLLFFAAVFIWGFRIYQTHQAKDPLAGLGPGLYQPANTNSGELLQLPPVPQQRP